ncbi:GtrA family protein [Sodalis sp. RH19]|uniref:GtrA family protein n=1 Tax=Sodalis sp. RH19 TaxID=3394334 RepID=UPI0039B3E953
MAKLFFEPSSVQFYKYCLVGLINTAVTAVVIFSLMAIGTNMYLANFSGYVVGILFSYFINSIFTFSQQITGYRMLKFALGCLLSYIVNVVIIKLVLFIIPDSIYVVQLFGMIAYTITGFIINKIWVMK